MINKNEKLPRRRLGATGLEISLLGLGGFHQCEVDSDTVQKVVERFIQLGGNYIETARSYGSGASEMKIGRAIEPYRNDLVMVSKTVKRDAESAWRELNETLEALRTDHLDLYFFHNINRQEDIEAISGKGGALEAFERAKQEGLIKHFAASTHWPLLLLDALKSINFEAVLIWGNYLDFCNFPELPETVIPELRRRNIGITFMKPLADGYLYRSVENAFRYALNFEPDCIVSGFNSVAMLEEDAGAVLKGPLNEAAMQNLLSNALELDRYVCRQCKDCPVLPAPQNNLLKKLFELEGKVDRQMNDFKPVDAGMYALRQRLGKWFGSEDRAKAMFAGQAEDFKTLSELSLAPCSYGIDIKRKIDIATRKLSDGMPERV